MRRRCVLIAFGATLSLISACGSEATTRPNDRETSENPAPASDVAASPPITSPGGDPPGELSVEDLTDGNGATLGDGQLAIVNYVGANWSNGETFDSSFGRSPFGLILGTGSVIPGWEQGLKDMKVGGRRQLVIPPELGYGDQEQEGIPANETLIFIVDLLDARPRPKPSPVSGVVSKLEIVDVAPGYGDRALESGDQALVHYTGVLAETGQEFDSSWDSGEAFQLQVGVGSVIQGWDEGLIGMKPGGRRRLVIPAELGYGAAGSPPSIGSDQALVFEVDLVALA